MSFDTEVVKDGRGVVILADFSTDGFTTRTRYANRAGALEGSTGRSNRIISLGQVRRGFGQNRVATGGACELVLDNSDGALDQWAGRDHMSTHASLRVRLSIAIYDPAVTVSDATLEERLLGYFVLTEWPRRTSTTITLQLGDDMLGGAGQLVRLPTLRDWVGVGASDTNPFYSTIGIPEAVTQDTPIQLAFGEDWVRALPNLIPWGSTDAVYKDSAIVPVCVTTSSDAGSDYEVESLRVEYWRRSDETLHSVDIPRTYASAYTSTPSALWFTERSPTITKDGVDFKVIYLVVSNGALNDFFFSIDQYAVVPGGTTDPELINAKHEQDGGYPLDAIRWQRDQGATSTIPSIGFAYATSRVVAWYVKGVPLSAQTQTTYAVQHATDVLADLAAYYSDWGYPGVDATSKASVKAGNPNAACAGVVCSWTDESYRRGVELTSPSLRQVMSAVCQSSDLDVFINWSGSLAFSSDVFGWAVATSAMSGISFEATRLADVEEWIPAQGERWGTFNRLTLTGGKDYPAESMGVPFQGPYDFAVGTTGVDITDRVIETTLPQGWRPWRQQVLSPLYWRSFDANARTKIRFRVAIDGLRLELGDFFTLTWSRGEAGSVYDAAVFQCESIAYASADDAVEIEAVWRNDVTTTDPYLLDDESLLVRSKGALTGSADLSDDAPTVVFGGTINLTTMGVAVGDMLVVRDSTEADDVFLQNTTYRITEVTDSTTLQVTPNTVVATIANADWYICRGYTTYPTAVSDPTNYPYGGDMYGKVANSSGEFSNSDPANLLISG